MTMGQPKPRDLKADRPDQPVGVAQAARHFGVDAVTIRRWIQGGCPCLRRGRRGPGLGALLDLQQVEQWRGASNMSAGLTVEDTLQQIASALCEALTVAHAEIRAGIERAPAAAVLLVAFERCCEKFGKTYRFDEHPLPIRTLMHEL